MMVQHAVSDVLAVFGPHLGTLGFLVNDFFALIVEDIDGIQLERYQAVIVAIQQSVAHQLGIDFLAHTAVVHVFVIEFDFDAVGKGPGLGTVTRLVVGQCWFQLLESLVITVNRHGQATDVFLDLGNVGSLCMRVQRQHHECCKYNGYSFHNDISNKTLQK